MNVDYMYEKDIPESLLRAYFLIASRWHLAIVIYQSHAIDPVYRFYGSQTQYVVIILQSVSTILICCSLMQKAKVLLLQLVAKSIDCSRAKVEKYPNYMITTEKKIFTNLKINGIN